MPADKWLDGNSYERFMGRWSRPVAREFLGWLSIAAGRRWLDVGCGTGILASSILEAAAPDEVLAIDFSEAFIRHARQTNRDPRLRFHVGDARQLPAETGYFDAVVSGLAINFVPDPEVALGEMVRAARTGGVVALYVWDYAGQMQMLRYFWDAALATDPAARELDEGKRFPICSPSALEHLFRDANLKDVSVRPVDVPTVFANFDDYWSPFLGGPGPAPGYVASVTHEVRATLVERLRGMLTVRSDGKIALTARAWAVKGRV